MSLHIAANTGCNLGCSYCYETPDRERKQEWVDRQYDLEKIFDQLHEWKQEYPDSAPGLHGGEPLLMRNEDIEEIFQWIDENYEGGCGIQTNGTLIEDEHIEMFEEYNVHVGLSIDGPDELNRQRKAAGERKTTQSSATDKMTHRTLGAIEKLIESDTTCSIIIVLHETNVGTDERLEKLLDWMDWLNKNGVQGHFNPAIPYEDIQEDVSISPERLKEVYLRVWEWMKAEPYREWNPMKDYIDNLIGNALGNCVNERCDVYNTKHAMIVKGNGETSGCGKTWEAVGDGVPFLQGPSSGNEYEETYERYEMLRKTPGPYTEDEPDMGGCKGCEYWNVCHGGCPSAGVNDDYRNRARWCPAKYALYEKIEQDMRAILPNITLVTDFPWDAPIQDLRREGWDADWKPFVRVRPGTEGKSSAYGGAQPSADISNFVPEPVMAGEDFDDKVERYKQKYDEESLEVDREQKRVHADSDMIGSTPTDSGWEKVDGGEDEEEAEN